MTESYAQQAEHLMLIVRELREIGFDPNLVILGDDGVTQLEMTLTDELSLIAFQINPGAATKIVNEGRSHG